ncbi:hypothetical protein EDD15DRAFT_2527414 [Pisolithus albus]|nr:hypothetical protein EDD15DRAFT_2527414 [Pisolithus albus]
MSEPPPAIQGQAPPQSVSTRGRGRGRGRGRSRGGAVNPETPSERIPTIRWDDKDPNIRARTARLLAWCQTNPETRIKLFSDSHLDAVNEGRSRQQMSAQKDTYYQQIAAAVFQNDYDPNIRQLYNRFPAMFVKPIKSRFQTLRRKYNEANKSLGSTGAGLTAEEIQDNPELKKLLNKILLNFPWWEDLHGFWRTNPSYNTVFSTGDPGQDFAAEAQQLFFQQQSTSNSGSLPIVDDEWAAGEPSCNYEGVSGEDVEIRGIDEEELAETPGVPDSGATSDVDHQTTSSSLHLSTDPTTPFQSSSIPDSCMDDISMPAVLQSLTSHAHQASGSNKGKGSVKPPSHSGSASLRPPSVISSSSSSARKRQRDIGSEISTKLSETSGEIIRQIQDSAEANSSNKRLRIQAHIISKELKIQESNAQREHELKAKRMDIEHEREMAEIKTKQLELELRLEEMKLRRMEAGKESGLEGNCVVEEHAALPDGN